MRQVPNHHKTRTQILTLLSLGVSLRAICRTPGMPSASTVCGWVRKHPEFARRYQAARRRVPKPLRAATTTKG